MSNETTVYWCQCLMCEGTGRDPLYEFGWEHCTLCGGSGKIYAIDPFGKKKLATSFFPGDEHG